MIAIHAGDTVRAYHARYAELATWRPERCPRCGAVGRMIGHWCYPRKKPLEAMPEPPQPIQVRRWLCTVCKHTTSMLPDILHRYRQYTWAVIGAALIRRFVLGQTWAQIQAALSQMPGGCGPGAINGQPAALVPGLCRLRVGLAAGRAGGVGHGVAAVGTVERPGHC